MSDGDGADGRRHPAPRCSACAGGARPPVLRRVCAAGEYDGHLEASTAARLSSLLRYALGTVPLDAFQAEHGKVGTPAVVVDDLTAALTRGIEELTRPIDAIKHQAKTVTVGISRTDETLLQVPLVAAVVDAGAPRDSLSYRTLRTLAGLDPAVSEVTGWIRYRVEGDLATDGGASAVVVDRGGIAREIPSRTRPRPGAPRHEAHRRGRARGLRLPWASRRQDPGVRARGQGRHVHGHSPCCTSGSPIACRRPRPASVLQGYRGRYAALRDAVTETEPAFREDLLAEQPVVDLLVEPIQPLADRWRS